MTALFNQIVLASNNSKKITELTTLLDSFNLVIEPQSKFNIPEIDEPYGTFVENALRKARHASKITGLPAIADDSGLCVKSLNLEPGVHSARYAGPEKSDKENTALLLKNMLNIQDRFAYYYCAIVFLLTENDPHPIIAEGIWRGEILRSPIGKNGFGYDPVFHDFITEKSAAELPPEVKNKISHRGKALQELKQKLTIHYG
jgi:XTP/dITP diphosphohydrolase